jgi:serine/threonine-protein kinase ULK/ATG1
LESAALAETLCGSPLYMAPEILQHQRYDSKADLWSTGAVLFECIAGKPPFNGVNHIDLLRNIQRKAVRLPEGVRVSSECVMLLRILLNRNPISRASFQEFYRANQRFVGLGCGGGGIGGI